MSRFWIVGALACWCACGPLSPPGADAGVDGGGATGGGGGTATGGGATGGGGAATGGGGGGTTGGGGGSTGGGGGGAMQDAGVPPLTWSSVAVTGSPSTLEIRGLDGTANDLWAVQKLGDVLHSTGGAFAWQFKLDFGAVDVAVAGSTVVVVQDRAIRTCTSNCTVATSYATLALLDSGKSWDLTGVSACAVSPTQIFAVINDTSSMGHLFEWNGTTWTRGAPLGLKYPSRCWVDASGTVFVAGQDKVVVAQSPSPLTTDSSFFFHGAVVDGAAWVVGQKDQIFRRPAGGAWAPVGSPGSSNDLLRAVGGLRGDEVFFFGNFSNTRGNGYVWNGSQLSSAGSLLPGFDAQSLVFVVRRVGDTLYVAGSNPSGPVIARGRR